MGDKVNSGIGLSYRPASHVAWRAGTTLSPSQGSMNSATVVKFIFVYMLYADRSKYVFVYTDMPTVFNIIFSI